MPKLVHPSCARPSFDYSVLCTRYDFSHALLMPEDGPRSCTGQEAPVPRWVSEKKPLENLNLGSPTSGCGAVPTFDLLICGDARSPVNEATLIPRLQYASGGSLSCNHVPAQVILLQYALRWCPPVPHHVVGILRARPDKQNAATSM